MRFATNKTWYYGTADLFVAKPKGGYLYHGGKIILISGKVNLFLSSYG